MGLSPCPIGVSNVRGSNLNDTFFSSPSVTSSMRLPSTQASSSRSMMPPPSCRPRQRPPVASDQDPSVTSSMALPSSAASSSAASSSSAAFSGNEEEVSDTAGDPLASEDGRERSSAEDSLQQGLLQEAVDASAPVGQSS